MRSSRVEPRSLAALPSGSDPKSWRGSLARAHDRFLSTGRMDHLVRPVVAESWRLSQRSGVSPAGVLPPVEFSDDELSSYRDGHALAAVMPLIRRLLVEPAEGQSALVAVMDAQARLLWVEGDPNLRRRAAKMNWIPGTRWDEIHAGTNAPATSLRTDRPVQFFSREHFAANVAPWSCAAAPIHHPITGQLLGALDITGTDDVAAPVVLRLVQATVAAAETELLVRALSAGLDNPAGKPAATVNRPGLSVLGRDHAVFQGRSRRMELSLRHSEMLLLLSSRECGYSAEKLAVDLHEEDIAPVTVRAEFSRLRKLLPEVDIDTRPYRLTERLETDLGRVVRHLRAGDLDQAFDEYAGPVLPSSESPAVAQIRQELEDELRSGALCSADPASVLRFAHTDSGRCDRSVWLHALEISPAAQRPVIATRLEAIDAQVGALHV